MKRKVEAKRQFCLAVLSFLGAAALALAPATAANAETQTFTLKKKLGYPGIEYSETLKFELPAGYRPNPSSIKSDLVFTREGLDGDFQFWLDYQSLEYSVSNWGNMPSKKSGYLGEAAAWISTGSGDNVEYVLLARSCDSKCTLFVRLPINARNKIALFESFKGVLLDRSYVLSSKSEDESHSQSQKRDRAGADEGRWLVIAGAWPSAENNKLKARMSLLSSNNITAHIIKTDEYSNLSPGLRAVVLGPTSKERAQAQLDSVKSIVPDAYIKEGVQ